MRWIGVETYQPAMITFPSDVKTVMVVNNSAQQPDRIGHRMIIDTGRDSVISVSLDSIAYNFCVSLGKNIANSTVFDDVRMCEDTLRTDSIFYDIRVLTPNQVSNMCHDYGVDALISLDYLLVISEIYKWRFVGPNANKAFMSKLDGELRTFWPGQREALVIPFTDSIFRGLADFAYYDGTKEDEIVVELDIEWTIRYMTEYMSEKIARNFVPYWNREGRWFYSSFASDWKQGVAYAAKQQWENAFKIWEPMYDNRLKWKRQARLAANLALCYEMTGRFEKAIEYAETAYTLMKEHTKDENNNLLKLQKGYVDVLKNRLDTEVVLSKQLREND